ncbi:sensor histidine kinase [Mucilaginibacter sp. AW1-3]
MNSVDAIIPFTIILFIIALGVIFLYVNFQKNLIEVELEKAELKSIQQDELLRNSIMIQEEERKRIAGDLHDEIGAVISIIKMNLMLMRQKQGAVQTNSATAEGIQNLINLSETAISSVRNISHQLMPPQLEAFGLIKTVESVIDHINQSGEITVNFIVKCEWPVIEWPVALGIYRILMELINNTIKHAKAGNIFLEFDYLSGDLIINFEDDGLGFPEAIPNQSGLGLTSMEARARALNGRFEYGNGDERGTKATITIPITNHIT